MNFSKIALAAVWWDRLKEQSERKASCQGHSDCDHGEKLMEPTETADTAMGLMRDRGVQFPVQMRPGD